MALVVCKFGGSSIATPERIRHVCQIIGSTYDQGNDVVVVLSAQGDTTDDLIDKAHEIAARPSRRELDALLAAGEQVSIALAAMCLENMGYPVISMNGQQAGIHTDSAHGEAQILSIDTEKIFTHLNAGRIVVIAGFQGVSHSGDITTLGRGGSDTTAVALASALRADVCKIFTDVDGVYSCDPRKDPYAVKYDTLSYDNMLSLIRRGAQVLHDRSVLIAKEHSLALEVLSSFTGNPGTLVI